MRAAVNGLATVVGATVVLLLAPVAARSDAGSLYSGPGQRPGPDILYQPPATAPQLTNAGVWHAPPILVSGTSAYRNGEYLYQDWLYDDHGAHGSQRDRNDAQQSPGGNSSSGDIFSLPNGTYTYPTDPAYAGNAADLVELRVKPLADATAFRITLDSLKDPSLVAFTIAIGGTPGVSLPYPHNANVSGPAQYFLTVHGSTADLLDAVTRQPLPGAPPTVTIDAVRRQMEVRVAHSAWDPAGKSVRLSAGVGLWDKGAGAYLPPQDNADATHPGGAGGEAAPAAFFNVAFRFEHSTDAAGHPAPNQEGTPSPSSNSSLTSPAWWRDQAQATSLAAHDMSPFYATVDFAKLASGASDDQADRSQGVPTVGPMDRILASHFETAQGRDYSKACANATECVGELPGRLQPYAIYIPRRPAPARGFGLTLLLHSLSANYNQYLTTNNQRQFGERGPGSIVITPEGRGPDGWYYDYAGADTFEVWADVASRYRLDAAYTAITGYSMGGYGTYKLSTQFPDLFAKAQPTVGPPGLGIWVPPGPPTGGDSSNTNEQLGSVRNIPFLIWNASSDELVPTPGPVAQAQTFGSLGYRYEFDLFSPAEHLTLAINDQFQPAADFLGDTRVDYDPPHVTYVYNPSMDFAHVGTAAGHAYWVSEVKLADPKANTGRGTADLRSEGFGVGDPTPSGSNPGGGALTGGTLPAISYQSQTQTWGAAPRSRPADRIVGSVTNVAALTIDAARAHVDCNADLRITAAPGGAQAPFVSTTLIGCPAAGRGAPVSLPSALSCASRRTLTIHLNPPRGARLTAVSVQIGRGRARRLRGGNLRAARIDLRGLPRGRFSVRVVATLAQGGRKRVITVRRAYRTCARGSGRRRPAGHRRPRVDRRKLG